MTTPLSQQLKQLNLSGVEHALQRQLEQPGHYAELSFTERLSLLFEHELTCRYQRKIERLKKQAKFRLHALPEQIDYRVARGIDKAQIRDLMEAHWLQHKQNLLITGATGCGKTFLACALGHHFTQQGTAVRYFRLKGLLEHLNIVHADGTYSRFLQQLTQTPLLILDDWGMETFTLQQRSDILDIMDARHQCQSTLITSQLPVEQWHPIIGEATYADAIMDRLVHTSVRLNLTGESMRKNAVLSTKT